MSKQNEEILDSLDKISMLITGSEASDIVFTKVLDTHKLAIAGFKTQKNKLKSQVTELQEKTSHSQIKDDLVTRIRHRLELCRANKIELAQLIPKYEQEL